MASRQYTTVPKIEAYMLIEVAADFEDNVTRWIKAVARYTEQVTQRIFSTTEEPTERVYDGSGLSWIMVDDFVDLQSITVDDGDPLEDDSYVVEPANRTAKYKIHRTDGGVFSSGRQNVTIEARFGYVDSDDLEEEEPTYYTPEDIEHANTVLVAGIINASHQHEGEIQSETIGRYSVTYKTEAEKNDFKMALQTLKQYRRYNLDT